MQTYKFTMSVKSVLPKVSPTLIWLSPAALGIGNKKLVVSSFTENSSFSQSEFSPEQQIPEVIWLWYFSSIVKMGHYLNPLYLALNLLQGGGWCSEDLRKVSLFHTRIQKVSTFKSTWLHFLTDTWEVYIQKWRLITQMPLNQYIVILACSWFVSLWQFRLQVRCGGNKLRCQSGIELRKRYYTTKWSKQQNWKLLFP